MGIDLGSSFVKVSLFDASRGVELAHSSRPSAEMSISAPHPSWAEQDPGLWWQCVQEGIAEVLQDSAIQGSDVAGVGISAQMHGLVALDNDGAVVRPAIIWCDGRAVEVGEEAASTLGPSWCFDTLLNAPGNFTASKLRWVQENEPQHFARIHNVLLPADFIAFKLSGDATTTDCGLSEAMLWDHSTQSFATDVFRHWDMDPQLVPSLKPSIGEQGRLAPSIAQRLGLRASIPIAYRCGDQPNNAFSLGAHQSGMAVVTAGTSAVIYSLSEGYPADRTSRVNTFLHPSTSRETALRGVLACLNGGGKWHSWVKKVLGGGSLSYEEMDRMALLALPGSSGIRIYPFGNGPERLLNNRDNGARIEGLRFNEHESSHLIRAGMEGIVFSLRHGLEIIDELGTPSNHVRAGLNNMFLSPVFQQMFVDVTGLELELYLTNGAEGAARGAALGTGYYSSAQQAFEKLKPVRSVEPQRQLHDTYADMYESWKAGLVA